MGRKREGEGIRMRRGRDAGHHEPGRTVPILQPGKKRGGGGL